MKTPTPKDLRDIADGLEELATTARRNAQSLRAQADLEEDPVHVHLVFPRREMKNPKGLLDGTGFYVDAAMSVIVDGDLCKDPTARFRVWNEEQQSWSVDVDGTFETRAQAEQAIEACNRRFPNPPVERSVKAVSA